MTPPPADPDAPLWGLLCLFLVGLLLLALILSVGAEPWRDPRGDDAARIAPRRGGRVTGP